MRVRCRKRVSACTTRGGRNFCAHHAPERVENMIGELFQPMHLLVVGIVALFVFGPDKLPQLGRTLGKAVRELRGAMNEPDDVTKDSTK